MDLEPALLTPCGKSPSEQRKALKTRSDELRRFPLHVVTFHHSWTLYSYSCYPRPALGTSGSVCLWGDTACGQARAAGSPSSAQRKYAWPAGRETEWSGLFVGGLRGRKHGNDTPRLDGKGHGFHSPRVRALPCPRPGLCQWSPVEGRLQPVGPGRPSQRLG